MPITGQYLRVEIEKALEDNAINPSIGLDSHLVDLVDATQEHWARINEEVRENVSRKGHRLYLAQFALVAGLTLCLALVVRYLLRLLF